VMRDKTGLTGVEEVMAEFVVDGETLLNDRSLERASHAACERRDSVPSR
jgi:hypothetical protein